jgi:hypothetical protein
MNFKMSNKIYRRRSNAVIARRRFSKESLETQNIQATNLAKYKALLQKRERQARFSKREENDEPPVRPPRVCPLPGRFENWIIYSIWREEREDNARRQYL